MTKREAQLLAWISENPMISQKELAKRAGITRSSVAVHISNLMKKGYIEGKGYVIGTPEYALVIGGINRDVGGISKNPLINNDSNPGNVRISLGGVGRNIAHNMALLGLDVKMLTAIGEDVYMKYIKDSCRDLNIDITQAMYVNDMPNAVYLYISDANGDMAVAVSDMDIYERLTPDYFNRKKQIIDKAKVVVLDTNLPEASLKWIIENAENPIFLDPVSTTKAEKIKDLLSGIHTLKPNKMEAEYLSGVKINDESSLEKAALSILKQGVKRVFISLGSDGVYCRDGRESFYVPCLKNINIKNTTGGGDAYMAGLVWGYMNDMSLEETGKLAMAASAIAVESSDTINEDLTIKKALDKAGMLNKI